MQTCVTRVCEKWRSSSRVGDTRRFLDGILRHLQDVEWSRIDVENSPLCLIQALVEKGVHQLPGAEFSEERIGAILTGSLLHTTGESGGCSWLQLLLLLALQHCL
jgi:hypothetical protein